MSPSSRSIPRRLCFPGTIVAFSALLLLLAPFANAQTAASAGAPSEKIAVLDLQAVGASEEEAVAVTERLREVLLKSHQYVVVDRSQIDAVLNEQALQQAACTEQDCAVQVGKILGVRKIVSGRAVKLGEKQWMLSALMVEVETAQTLRVESIRYRGDLLDMLDRQVPPLGRRLAGLEDDSQDQSAASDAVTISLKPSAKRGDSPGEGAPLKVAVFPSLLEGEYSNRLHDAEPRVMSYVQTVIGASGDAMELTYSHLRNPKAPEAYERFREQPAFAGLADEVWSGLLIKDPDEAIVYSKGRELGVDLVLMYQTRVGKRGQRIFKTYLFDVNRLRSWQKSGTFGKGEWGKVLVRSLSDLLDPYKNPKSKR